MSRPFKVAIVTWFLFTVLVCKSAAKPIHDVQFTALPPAEKASIDDRIENLFMEADPSVRSLKDLTLKSYGSDEQTSLSLESTLKEHYELIPSLSVPRRRKVPPLSPASSSLNKRAFIPSDYAMLKMTKFKAFVALAPTLAVVAKLQDFYDIIALKLITGAFSDRPPSYNIILQLWDLELNFTCDKVPVPWDFVQAWVIDMASASAQSFTGFYEATVRGVLVKMKLQDSTLPAIT